MYYGNGNNIAQMQVMSDTCLYSGRCYSTMHPRLKMKLTALALSLKRNVRRNNWSRLLLHQTRHISLARRLVAREVREALFAGEAN